MPDKPFKPWMINALMLHIVNNPGKSQRFYAETYGCAESDVVRARRNLNISPSLRPEDCVG